MMKLNYTSLQHPVDPVESPPGDPEAPVFNPMGAKGATGTPVLVLPLHGHLAPAAWAAAQAQPGLKLGYVQTGGGALPGSLSRDVAELRERGLLCGHLTAAPAYGGEHEAISVAGALDAAAAGWAGTRCSPGPGRGSSARRRGSGTAASPRSTPPTPHWPSGCRPCSRRASPRRTRASATVASATTR